VASYAFGNHDQMRLVTRRGEPVARAAAVLLLTLPGMAFIYNGEEIGMADGEIPPEMIQDPQFAGGYGRDPARTPMQWTDKENAGFSTAHTTWLPVAANYKTHNVETESADSHSFLSLYRTLGQLRNNAGSIKYGKFKVVDVGIPDVLCYVRSKGKEKYAVFINFSKDEAAVTLPEKLKLGTLIVSSDPESQLASDPDGRIHLRPYEAAVFSC
jgi:alpha-glucosidase